MSGFARFNLTKIASFLLGGLAMAPASFPGCVRAEDPAPNDEPRESSSPIYWGIGAGCLTLGVLILVCACVHQKCKDRSARRSLEMGGTAAAVREALLGNAAADANANANADVGVVHAG